MEDDDVDDLDSVRESYLMQMIASRKVQDAAAKQMEEAMENQLKIAKNKVKEQKQAKGKLKNLMGRIQKHMHGEEFETIETDADLTTETIHTKCFFQVEYERLKPVADEAIKIKEDLAEAKEKVELGEELNKDLEMELDVASQREQAQITQISEQTNIISILREEAEAEEMKRNEERRKARLERMTLEEEIEELKSRLRKSEVAKEMEVEVEKEKVEKLKEKVQKLTSTIERERETIIQKESELSALNESHQSYMDELSAAAEKEDPVLREELDKLRQDRDDIKKRLSETQEELRELGEEKSALELRAKIMEHEKEKSAQQSTNAESGLAALQVQNDALSETISDLRQQLAEQKEQTTEMIKEQKENTSNQLTESKMEMNEKIAELKELLSEQRQETKEAKAEAKEYQRELAEARVALMKKETEAESTSKENESLQATLSGLESKQLSEKEESSSNNAEILVELGHLRGQNDAVASQLNESLQLVTSHAARAEALDNVLAEMRNELNNLKLENERLRSEVEKAHLSEQEAKLRLGAAEDSLEAAHRRYERAEEQHEKVIEDRRIAEARVVELSDAKHEVEKTIAKHEASEQFARSELERLKLDHAAALERMDADRISQRASLEAQHDREVENLQETIRKLTDRIASHEVKEQKRHKRLAQPPTPYAVPEFDSDEDPLADEGVSPKKRGPTSIATRAVTMLDEDDEEEEVQRRLLATIAEQIKHAESDLSSALTELVNKEVEVETCHATTAAAQLRVKELSDQVSDLNHHKQTLQENLEAFSEKHITEVRKLQSQLDDNLSIQNNLQSTISVLREQLQDFLIPVLLQRSDLSQSFGFAVGEFGTGRLNPHLISNVVEGEAADGDSGLQVGDELVTVNGSHVALLTHAEVIQLIVKQLTLNIEVIRFQKDESETYSPSFGDGYQNIDGAAVTSDYNEDAAQNDQDATEKLKPEEVHSDQEESPSVTEPVNAGIELDTSCDDTAIIEKTHKTKPQVSNNLELISVEIRKNNDDIGFHVCHDHAIHGLRVAKVDPSGPAEKLIEIGDTIVKVNGNTILGLPYKEAEEQLNNSGNLVVLGIHQSRNIWTEDHNVCSKLLQLEMSRPQSNMSYGFGFGLIDEMHCFPHVTRVSLGGPADGVLQPDDVIVAVNGVSAADEPHYTLVNRIDSNDKLFLVVARGNDAIQAVLQCGRNVCICRIARPSPNISYGMGLGVECGTGSIVIASVGPESPASGVVSPGDVIRPVNKQRVPLRSAAGSVLDLIESKAEMVELEVIRNGSVRHLLSSERSEPNPESAVSDPTLLHAIIHRSTLKENFGVSVLGAGKGSLYPYVRAIRPGSPCDGLVEPGDRILVINGRSVYGMAQPAVVELIRSSRSLKLELERGLPLPISGANLVNPVAVAMSTANVSNKSKKESVEVEVSFDNTAKDISTSSALPKYSNKSKGGNIRWNDIGDFQDDPFGAYKYFGDINAAATSEESDMEFRNEYVIDIDGQYDSSEVEQDDEEEEEEADVIVWGKSSVEAENFEPEVFVEPSGFQEIGKYSECYQESISDISDISNNDDGFETLGRAHIPRVRFDDDEIFRTQMSSPYAGGEFPCTVRDSSSARRLRIRGQSTLFIGPDGVTLVAQRSQFQDVHFPLIHIKKYGDDSDVLSLEIGHLGGSLAGIYFFEMQDPAAAFDLLGNLMRQHISRSRTKIQEKVEYASDTDEVSDLDDDHFWETINRSEGSDFETAEIPVVIRDSASARKFKLRGRGTLIINPWGITLVADRAQFRDIYFPLEHIKKYGDDLDVFSLEVGHIGGALAGVYFFQMRDASEAFNLLNKLMRQAADRH